MNFIFVLLFLVYAHSASAERIWWTTLPKVRGKIANHSDLSFSKPTKLELKVRFCRTADVVKEISIPVKPDGTFVIPKTRVKVTCAESLINNVRGRVVVEGASIEADIQLTTDEAFIWDEQEYAALFTNMTFFKWPEKESLTAIAPDGLTFGAYVQKILEGSKFEDPSYFWSIDLGYHYTIQKPRARHQVYQFVSDFHAVPCYPLEIFGHISSCVASIDSKGDLQKNTLYSTRGDRGVPRYTLTNGELPAKMPIELSVGIELSVWKGARDCHVSLKEATFSETTSLSEFIKPREVLLNPNIDQLRADRLKHCEQNR